jgi:predicted Zn-dependent protease
MVAKLVGFLEKPEYTLLKYTDNSVPSIYARSIAYYKKPDLKKALAEIDKLITKYPSDPFFNELKGQFLAESGRPAEALKYYKKADELFPNNSLLKLELGKLQLSQNMVDDAINSLTKSAKLENSSASWRFLAVAYGKKDNQPMVNLALAEEATMQGKKEEAQKYAEKALDKLPKNSPAKQRAEDIIHSAKEKKDD